MILLIINILFIFRWSAMCIVCVVYALQQEKIRIFLFEYEQSK